MTTEIGEVIAVNGIHVTLRIFEESNDDVMLFEGNKYRGVSVREYISIQRGARDIICFIEKEYLEEKKVSVDSEKTFYVRKAEVRPIGYYEDQKFNVGIKFLPMIKDPAFILPEGAVSEIYNPNVDKDFIIGGMLKEGIPVSLPWQKLFNTHVGIFGNTGSGKSNTLVKLYTVLFEQKLKAFGANSKFIILDFNGEYTAGQLAPPALKHVLQLSTQGMGQDKFSLTPDEFWDADTLSILFQANTNTQLPFLRRVVSGKKKYNSGADNLLDYLKRTFKFVFTSATSKSEALDLLRNIAGFLGLTETQQILKKISWNANAEKFCANGGATFNSDGIVYDNVLATTVNAMTCRKLDVFDELTVLCDLRFVTDLIHGYVQFDSIQPLIKRMEVSMAGLRNVLKVEPLRDNPKPLTVISLRRCNQDIKNVLPILIAKHYYYKHKSSVETPPNKTIHLIIDEAHNILSVEATADQASWKDHKLELFEEIIKEGRKFGMFVTLASQRPADISPTIVSQLHNFFIHRLVNDRDLALLDNTINTLDNVSKSLIPSLSKGSCIVTGTSFDLPMVIQVKKLDESQRPNSDDVNLENLWS